MMIKRFGRWLVTELHWLALIITIASAGWALYLWFEILEGFE